VAKIMLANFDNLIPKPYDWNRCMMDIAFDISKMSKDPSTQVGAVLVSPDRTQISLGYNGFPPKIPDYRKWWDNRISAEGMTKYDVVRHAERNCITQAKTSLVVWTMYVTHFPCIICAIDIIAEGITRVFYATSLEAVTMPIDSEKVKKLFWEAGIELTYLNMRRIEDNEE